MSVFDHCQPRRVFHYFEEICNIPHGSGNTKEISDYLVKFAQEHNLSYVQDEKNNVIIYKKATSGHEQAPTVILQGHMDMVCEKESHLDHDFTRDPLRLALEDGYVFARGTTLGGDDGIAIAYALALLESDEFPHPALEVLLTVDEEIGLLGAQDLDTSKLQGKCLINLDSEEEGILLTGCAGGVSAISTIPVKYRNAHGFLYEISIHGLTGGHSGAEIDKNRANANVLMGRLLYGLKKTADYEVSWLDGGKKDNVIPRECRCHILLSTEEEEASLTAYLQQLEKELRKEYAGSDEGISIGVKALGETDCGVLHPVSREKILFYMMSIPNGVQKMSGNIPGLVETSMNFGTLELKEDAFYASSGIRSSVNAAKYALSDQVEYLTEFLGGDYELEGAYPAWEYRENSPLRDHMVKIYQEMYHKDPTVEAIHAGLECGIFYEKMPGLDCISIGPDILDIHTPQERMNVESVKRVWEYLLNVLKTLE